MASRGALLIRSGVTCASACDLRNAGHRLPTGPHCAPYAVVMRRRAFCGVLDQARRQRGRGHAASALVDAATRSYARRCYRVRGGADWAREASGVRRRGVPWPRHVCMYVFMHDYIAVSMRTLTPPAIGTD